MYVCTYVRTYVCTYVHTYVCMNIHYYLTLLYGLIKKELSASDCWYSLHFQFLQLIAPFGADVEIGGTGSVFYRQTTDPDLLVRTTNEIQSAFPTSSNNAVETLLIVTWDDVGYYFQHTDKVCIYMYIHILYSRNTLRAEIFED